MSSRSLRRFERRPATGRGRSEGRHVAADHHHQRLIDRLEPGQQTDERASVRLRVGDDPQRAGGRRRDPVIARGNDDHKVRDDGREGGDRSIEEGAAADAGGELVGSEPARSPAGEHDPADRERLQAGDRLAVGQRLAVGHRLAT